MNPIKLSDGSWVDVPQGEVLVTDIGDDGLAISIVLLDVLGVDNKIQVQDGDRQMIIRGDNCLTLELYKKWEVKQASKS